LIVDILRHGALQGGVKYRGHVEGVLTQEGRQQMDAVWEQLKEEVDVVVASPLQRCALPAQAWASEQGIPCLLDERIKEMYYGAWEDKTHAEIESEFPGMLAAWRQDPTGMQPPGGGESPETLRHRVADFWQDMKQQYAHQHLLVVGHSGSLRMLVTHIEQRPIAHTRAIHMPYASWKRLVVDGGAVDAFRDMH